VSSGDIGFQSFRERNFDDDAEGLRRDDTAMDAFREARWVDASAQRACRDGLSSRRTRFFLANSMQIYYNISSIYKRQSIAKGEF